MKEKYNLGKWLNDEMNDENLASFQNEEDYEFYEKVKKYSSQLETTNFDNDSMLKSILSSKKNKNKIFSLSNNSLFKIAASIAILLSVFYFYKQSFDETITLGNGTDTLEVALPDHSKVILNDGSELKFSKWNWNNNRNLKLAGEAYFKVAKGNKFKVNTSLGTVTVVGTEFNVKERNNRFDVTCYDGKVNVVYQNQETTLIKGQTVSFENNSKIIEHPILNDKPDWLDNKMAFEKEKLTNIIDEFQRQFNIQIDLGDATFTQLFTGKIPTDNSKLALQIIASTYNLKSIKISENNYSFEKYE